MPYSVQSTIASQWYCITNTCVEEKSGVVPFKYWFECTYGMRVCRTMLIEHGGEAFDDGLGVITVQLIIKKHTGALCYTGALVIHDVLMHHYFSNTLHPQNNLNFFL